MTTTTTRPSERAGTESGPTTMIASDTITKSFAVGRRQVEILHGVAMGVSEGEFCAVMGPSGSGKSTLLYCLAGLERPTTGDVRLLGNSLNGLSRGRLAEMRRTDVGFVFQSYNLVPTLTAYENVALPYRLRHQRPDRDVVMTSLEKVGVQKLADARPPSMSGGEQQRVALARVLAQQPQIIFADEPTGALDTTSGRLVLEELKAIAHQPGRCVLTVTHDPVVASHCDRVLFMRDGLLVRQLTSPTSEMVTETLASLTLAAEADAEASLVGGGK